MTFAGGEIWEFWAIMNSFLTTFTLQITSKGRGEVWAAIASGVISFLALGALGFHHVIIFGLQHQVAYGILLVLALLGYTVSDILLWVHGGMEESEFLAIFYFVDMPVLVGFVIFFAYVVSELRLPENVRLINDDFIGGAIAFQLILGNIVLSFIRGRITDYTVPFVRLKAWLKSSGDSMRS